MTEITEEECAWLEFLRMIGGGSVPRVTLAAVQALRSCHGARKVSASMVEGPNEQEVLRLGPRGRIAT